NRGGARPGAGNPGIGKMKQLKDNMDKYEPLFWQLMERFGHSRSKEDQRFFVQEFNKLQAKLIPQQLSGEGGGPIEQRIIYLPQRERMETTSREANGSITDNAAAGV